MGNKVFMLLYDIDVNKGGITSVMLSRSRELSFRHGYDVDLVSLDYKNNYEEIQEKLIDDGRLYPKVNIINVHNYFRDKYSQGKVRREQLHSYEVLSNLNEDGYYVQDNEYKTKNYARYFKDGLYKKYKKWSMDGHLSHIDYFNESRNRTAREEFHKEGYIYRRIYFDLASNQPKQELHYTKDGFCYLTKWFNHKDGNIQRIYLFDRHNQKVFEFKNNKDFHVFFLNDLCSNQTEKPFLICDGVGSASKVLSMKTEAAHRIYAIHTNHFDYPHKYGSPTKSDHVTLLKNLKNIEALVVLTESQKEDIVKQFGDYQNVFVIPNFITPIKDFKLIRDPKLVTMISRYHPEKGIDEAITAFKRVVKEIPDARLEIYGHGEDEDRLASIINELRLTQQVKLMGYSTKIGEVLGKSSLTILTSQFEGLNVVSLESMSCKVPVVSYDVNYGMRDIISDGKNGFLVPYGDREVLADRIIQLLKNPNMIKKLGNEAYELVSMKYSKLQVCKKWVSLFQRLENKV